MRAAGVGASRAVRCVETGEVFPSIAEANRSAMPGQKGAVGRACEDPAETAGGFHWEYA